MKFVLPALACAPVLLMAFSGQPPVQRTGAPAAPDNSQSCAACHLGNPVNSGQGSVSLQAPNYTPGQKLAVQIRITHNAGRERWGFQITARRASNPTQVAGTFTARSGQVVRCATGVAAPCFGGVEYLSHDGAPRQSGTSYTFVAEWTAPATDIGDVIFYVAANAANGNGTNSGDFIYIGSRAITLATVERPAIATDGVVTAGDFGGVRRIASGSWVEIYGSNLSTITREWAGWDFNGDNAPTSLEGVSVQIGGKPAFLRFVSPNQINVQAPADIGIGSSVPVIVTNAGGISVAAGVLGQALTPGLLSPAPWRINNRPFVYAQSGNEVVGVAAGSIAGLATRPARPGELIVLYGAGFGRAETLPTPGTVVAPGVIARGETRVQTVPTFRIGQIPATLTYAGLAPNYVGLYQFNLTVPESLGSGEYDLTVNVDDQQVVYRIAVER